MTSARPFFETALAGCEYQISILDQRIAEIRTQFGHPRRGGGGGDLPTPFETPARKERKPLSAAVRKRMAAAQRKRWTAVRKDA